MDASEVDTPEPGSRDRAMLLGLWLLSVAVNFVLSGFELGIVVQDGQHADSTTQEISLMFAECSLVMFGVNALLFFTSLLDKVPSHLVIAVGSLIGVSGLALLGFHQSKEWMLIGISLTAAGTGLVLPVISFLAAVPSRGWLFCTLDQLGFGWLALPLVATLILILFRPPRSATTGPAVRVSSA